VFTVRFCVRRPGPPQGGHYVRLRRFDFGADRRSVRL